MEIVRQRSKEQGTGQGRNQGEAVFEVKQNWSIS